MADKIITTVDTTQTADAFFVQSAGDIKKLPLGAVAAVAEGLGIMPIIASNFGSNSGYAKYASGLVIAWQRFSQANVPITTAWGSIYDNGSRLDLGSMPNAGTTAQFSAAPFVNISAKTTSEVFLGGVSGTTATAWGGIWLARATPTTMVITLDIIAIGYSAA